MTNVSCRSIILLVFALVFCASGLSPVVGQEVDVYFVVGQSNAANFATNTGFGVTDVGFDLHLARTSNSFNDFPNHTSVAQQFSSSNLNPSLATTILASDLRRPGRDVGIFSFARGATPI